MRRPQAALASSIPSPPARLQTSPGAPAASANSSVGWTLPPLNQFMTLPRRFLASRLVTSVNSSADSANSSSDTGSMDRHRAAATSVTLDNLLNDEDEGWHVPNHFVLPHMVHFQEVAEAPTHQSQEIDLTLSSDEEEADSDVIEILEPTEGDPQPTPLRRKRRRPGADALLVPKRQRMTDMMRSAESTNVSIHNSEVVEEFKRRLKCSICLDVLEDMTSTLCGHIFCATCIHQAIRANGKCPLCQRHLHLKDTHRLFF